MSSATLTQAKTGAVGAWETGKEVFFAHINPATMEVTRPISAPGTGANRKHPVAVSNSKGETLFAWTEGTGWAKGGSLAWQIFNANDKPESEKGRAEGVPTWSLITAFAKPDGNFVIIY
jgi:hypothetical protein